jgi:hypothetical protein
VKTLEKILLDKYSAQNAGTSIDKGIVEAACWNWALYGVVPVPVASPDFLFKYVNRGELGNQLRAEADAEFKTNTGNVWAHLQAGQALRAELDKVRTDYDAAADNTATRNAIRDRVFELSLRHAGFTISLAETPYRICIIEPKDVLMWDHWWLEINGSVVETVTGKPLYSYSTQYLAPAFNLPRNRFGAKAARLGPDLQARVHARYVTELQDQQVGYLDVLAGAIH